MEIKILINTPKGQAKGTEKKLRPFLLGKNKPKELWTNEEDNQIVWIIDTDVRRAMKIQRNVMVFDKMMESVLNHKYVKGTIHKKLSKEDQAQLKDMLQNQTTVEVIKTYTDEDNKRTSIWEKIKSKFVKDEQD